MPIYKYTAKNKEGKLYEKTTEVLNRNDVYKIIREEGGIVVSVKQVRKIAAANLFAGMFGGIKTHEKIMLARNLGSMINAGLSVTRSLNVLEKQSKRKTLKKLFAELGSDVSHGQTLSEAMQKKPNDFSSLFVSMVRAGEESGNLAGALTLVANQMEKSYLIMKKVKGALIYPAVVISVMILIAILMLIYMVPTLTATFEGLGAELPLSTRIIVFMSRFLVSNTLLVISFALLFFFCTVVFFRSKFGKRILDKVTLNFPIIGPIFKEVQSARTARTLSSLLSAGVEIVVSLNATIDVLQNHLYKDALTKAREAIEKGEPMSVIFQKNEHLYPLFVGEMVAVGEETGKISEMLLGVADYYEDEVDQKTKNLSTIIEPLIMVVIGAGVAFFALAMLGPTYSLVDYI